MAEVQRDPDLRGGRGLAQDVHGASVRKQQVVRCRQRVALADATRSVVAPPVADPGRDPRLVDRDPAVDAVAEAAGDGADVLLERVDGPPRRPAAFVLEHLREIPVVERRERPDARGQQRVDEPVVEVEPALVDGAAPLRQHARPGDRETEGVEPELAHERHVVAVTVIEVARDLAGVAVPDLAGRRREPVPDALAASVRVRRALDLVRGGGGAPDEVAGEDRAGVGSHGSPLVQVGEGAVT